MYYLVYFLTLTSTLLSRVPGADRGGDVRHNGGHGGPLPARVRLGAGRHRAAGSGGHHLPGNHDQGNTNRLVMKLTYRKRSFNLVIRIAIFCSSRNVFFHFLEICFL